MTDRIFHAARIAARLVLGLSFLCLCALCFLRATPAQAIALPDPATGGQEAATETGAQTAVLAGGCFWGMQDVFEHVKGVMGVVAGYAGGAESDANYESVSTGTTGHAESVKITYDPSVIGYGQILKIYFSVAHDPTQMNRQGPDSGTQYRSVIFYATPEQQQAAQDYIAQLQKAKVFPAPIVTEVRPLEGFYPAEDYHQDYAKNHPENPYISVNDQPKVDDLQREFPQWYVDSIGP